jgi:uncharacterized protein (TIGR00255 family)
MSKPTRSMTGYARAQRSIDAGDISVSVKSVNHRALDLHFHLPPEFDLFENSMRTAIKEAVVRGHLDVRATFTPRQAQDGGLNLALFRAWVAAFRQAAAETGSNDSPDLSAALRTPGMVAGQNDALLDENAEAEVLAALRETLDGLNSFRTREGAELVSLIRRHNSAIQARVAELERIRSQAIPLLQNRLQERLRELLRSIAPDPQRMMQEAAVLADRSDIGEEIARLGIHAGQLATLLEDGGEVGKKLDFLLQEMNRETNTILSKTTGIGDLGLRITDLALATKADIEKIREQVLNLE